jgi:hypothetical protein
MLMPVIPLTHAKPQGRRERSISTDFGKRFEGNQQKAMVQHKGFKPNLASNTRDIPELIYKIYEILINRSQK